MVYSVAIIGVIIKNDKRLYVVRFDLSQVATVLKLDFPESGLGSFYSGCMGIFCMMGRGLGCLGVSWN